MKKTIISIAAAVLCASALSVPAFAENILADKSVYADNQQELAGYPQHLLLKANPESIPSDMK